MDPFKQVADAINGRQITDDEGKLMPEETGFEKPTAQEENAVEETATAEKSAETETIDPKSVDEGTETQLAEDETGKRYVPENRFKEVYGEKKRLERELDAAKKQQAQVYQPTQPMSPVQPSGQGVDKTTALELDLLKMTLPQFNSDSDDYDSELDKLGASIYKANPGITMLEAGRRAIATAKALTRKQTQIAQEARQVKAIQ